MLLVAAISNEVLWVLRAGMFSIQVLFMDLLNHFLQVCCGCGLKRMIIKLCVHHQMSHNSVT